MRIALLLVLGTAALLRVWAVDFGMPFAPEARPDEREVIMTTVHFFQGDFRPNTLHYPTLFMYVLFGCYAAFAWLGVMMGTLASLREMPFVFVSGYSALHVIARLLSAAFGVATVYVVWRIALREFGRRTGLLSAALLSVAYLHVRDSHFGVTDVAMTFFVAWAHAPILSILRGGGIKSYLGAGALWGLAASTKYNGAGLGAPLVVAHALRRGARWWDWRGVLLAGAVALAAFACTSPYCFIEFGDFWWSLRYEVVQRTGQTHVLNVGLGWWRHASVSLRWGLGLPMCLAAVCGGAWLARRRPRLGAVLLALPVAYYMVIGVRRTVFVRYALPLLPSLAIFAGYFCARALERLPRAAGVAMLLAVALPTTVRSVQWDGFMQREDTRCIAARWLQAHLEPGDMVGWTGVKYTIATPPAELEARKHAANVVGFVDTAEQLRERWPRFMVTCDHAQLGHFCRVPVGIAELLAKRYRLVVVFDPLGAETYRDTYDLQDAFFAPYAGFHAARRPGPKILIYQLASRPAPRAGVMH